MSLANLQHGAINSGRAYEKWKNYEYLPLYYFWAPEGNNPRFIGLIWIILNGLKHCCWKASYSLAKCCSVAKSCPILCNPMDSSTPGFPVLHISQSLLKLMSVELMMPSNHLILCCPFSSCLHSFPTLGSFPKSQLFTSSGQNIGVSASASGFPMTTQGWFPLGLTGLISLLSKGLSRVFSSNTFRKYQFFGVQPS